MTTTEKLYKTVQDLPEPIIAELLDFAEFLRRKMLNEKLHPTDELLTDLTGGLEKFGHVCWRSSGNSKTVA